MSTSSKSFFLCIHFIDDTCIKWRAVYNASDERENEFLGIIILSGGCVTHCTISWSIHFLTLFFLVRNFWVADRLDLCALSYLVAECLYFKPKNLILFIEHSPHLYGQDSSDISDLVLA